MRPLRLFMLRRSESRRGESVYVAFLAFALLSTTTIDSGATAMSGQETAVIEAVAQWQITHPQPYFKRVQVFVARETGGRRLSLVESDTAPPWTFSVRSGKSSPENERQLAENLNEAREQFRVSNEKPVELAQPPFGVFLEKGLQPIWSEPGIGWAPILEKHPGADYVVSFCRPGFNSAGTFAVMELTEASRDTEPCDWVFQLRRIDEGTWEVRTAKMITERSSTGRPSR
ncbi:MAG: hypothetical protein QOI58_1412 [Thermoanaerobaculia bacterium]|nr:hypothetical protein [Thermoanaerobaculia bacterium]